MYGRMSPTFFELFCKKMLDLGWRIMYFFRGLVVDGLRGGLELEFKSLDVFFEIIQKRDMSICFGWYYVKKIFVFIILFMIMFFFL